MNPFKTGSWDGVDYFAVTADDRVAMVRRFDRDQCTRALALDDLQKTVASALKRRLRKLDREDSTLATSCQRSLS